MPSEASSTDSEIALPEGVSGYAAEGFGPVVKVFAKLYTGRRPGGGALAVSVRGKPVLDIWAGSEDRAGAAPWTHDTGSIIFSASKGLASTVVHRLADRGLIDYDAPMAEYWPAFAKGGKQAVTVRQVMAHEAGLSRLSGIANSYAEIVDHLLVEDRLAAAHQDRFAGKPAYHALTYGWLLDGLARAVTGKGMRALFREELAAPLGVDGIHLGRPPADSPTRTAALIGPRVPSHPLTYRVIRIGGKVPGPFNGLARTIFAGPGTEKLIGGGYPPLLDVEVPAAGAVATAPALAKLYAALAGDGSVDGRRLVSPQTARTLSAGRSLGKLATYRLDRTAYLPMMWHLGYHSILAPTFTSGFGHMGLGGSTGWACPSRGIAAGYVHNRMPSTLLSDQASFVLLWPLIVRAASGRGTSFSDR